MVETITHMQTSVMTEIRSAGTVAAVNATLRPIINALEVLTTMWTHVKEFAVTEN